MTTLHGLVTISELLAGFNLINTGIVNCLIVSECTQNAPFPGKKFLGRGTAPCPIGEALLDTPAKTPLRSVPRYSRFDLAPQTKILDPPVTCLHPALSCAAASIFLQLCLKMLCPFLSPYLFPVSTCPLFLLSCGVYSNACLAILSSFLLNVCRSQFHFLLSWVSMGSCSLSP